MERFLFIWVEGGSDARLFEAVFKPLFEKKYRRVEIRTYANLKREAFQKILLGMQSMEADFIVVADIDQEPCITSKKKYVQTRIKGIEDEWIRVVIQEIESWYLAGVNESSASLLGLPVLNRTDTVTKEQFIAMMPEQYDSRIDFMMEILKTFSIATAMEKNDSFRYFVSKHKLEFIHAENFQALKKSKISEIRLKIAEHES
jgi:hypothetical protein